MSKNNKGTTKGLNKGQIDTVIELHLKGLSSRKICDELDIPRSRKSTVNNILAKWRKGDIVHSGELEDLRKHLPKILVLDIETAPILGAVWSLWRNNVGLNQICNDWFILSYAAKWLGSDEDEVFYKDMRGKVHTEDDTEILDDLWKLLDEADICLTQNGVSFDVPKIKARMVLNGYKPFSPVKHIDTLHIAKREFNFTSNKLAYMTDKLCEKYKKLDHGKFSGFDLWAEMMKDNLEAFEECEEYNRYDVLSLEELYTKLQAWDSKHVNFNLYSNEDEHVCRCGSKRIKEDGFAYTGVSKFQQYRCLDCGATTRGRVNLFSKEKRKSLHMNVRN